LEHHDRGRVEIFCYSNHYRVDEVTQRLKEKSDHWAAIVSESDALAAERIRHDKIDILVDLSGHTARNRLKLFALKPAPLQVTWLGYPNTTGLRAIDYRVTDRVTDPQGRVDRLHTERLARLNRCFLCYRPPDDAPAVGPIPARTADHVTFGSFNNLTKITSEVVRAWSRILSSVSGSRLFLKARQLADERIREELIAQFSAQGIIADRLRLSPTIVSQAEHLGAYSRVDIGLDTFPYNGTTTTCEALWMGVPVISLAGSCHAGRVGSSLLQAVALDELIAPDEDSYVCRAVALAQDRDGLERFRAGLRERMRRSELCDGPAFAAAMENVYREMWLAWRHGATRRSALQG
jgi:protein O-GlcNAc transferase